MSKKKAYEVYICKYDGEIVYIGEGALGRHNHCTGGTSHVFELNELYFYSDNQKIIDVVMSIDWRDEVKSISGKKLPKGLALEIIQNKLSCDGGELK